MASVLSTKHEKMFENRPTISQWMPVNCFRCSCVTIAASIMCLVLIAGCVQRVSSLPDSPKLTYEELYKSGVDAYLDQRWYECVSSIERALEDYFYYRTSVIHCRSFCKNASDIGGYMLLERDKSARNTDIYNDMFSVLVRDALCLMKCEKAQFRERPPTLNREMITDFENKLPYDYLQLCYFKIGDAQKAASCAYTFLIHNPNHEVMHKNLQYYLDQPKVHLDRVKYLEAKDYQEMYMEAAKAYNAQQWESVIELMEKAVKKYLKAEEECRLLCEGTGPSVAEPVLILNIANHYTFTLRCKINCPEKLSYMYGQKQDNFFSSQFHYLQYAYYKTNQLKNACEAVASYLALRPDDQIMIDNKEYYLKMDGVSETWFKTRLDIEAYATRVRKENELLEFIEKSFDFPEILEPTEFSMANLQRSLVSSFKESSRGFRMHTLQEMQQWSLLNGIRVVQREEELNGSLRFTADGFASPEECNKLILLAQKGAIHGDGYNGKQSPHTEFEQFEGLTIGRAVTLTEKGILDAFSTQLLLDVSDKARTYVEMYFGLPSKLYFAYTHLVCRTAIPGSPNNRIDLSHPVHADNCLLLKTGECLKEKPAYIWRDYSAIVYLNNDFEGGEFIFAKDKNTIQARVKPKCGRMVAFSAGKENLHGVQAVTKGKRCALAMWYTLDPRHQERERIFAEQVLTDTVVHKEEGGKQKIEKEAEETRHCSSCQKSKVPDFKDLVTDVPLKHVHFGKNIDEATFSGKSSEGIHIHEGL